MKITVIKKTTGKGATLNGCPYVIDEPPVAKR